MDGRRERYFAGQMIGHQPNRQLALTMWLLIDGSRDGSFLKVRGHFGEKIRSDQLGSSGQTSRAQSAANRKAIHGIHVQSRKLGTGPEDRRSSENFRLRLRAPR